MSLLHAFLAVDLKPTKNLMQLRLYSSDLPEVVKMTHDFEIMVPDFLSWVFFWKRESHKNLKIDITLFIDTIEVVISSFHMLKILA